MSNGILLFIEPRDRVLGRTRLEALVAAEALAASLGESLAAVVLGRGVSNVAQEIAAKKLDSVYLVEDDALAEYTPDGYVAAFRQVIEKLAPNLVIMSH